MSDERVVCTACGTINRVPAGKDATAAKMRQLPCRAVLFGEKRADVSAAMLERQVEKGTLPVVMDVWAHWCARVVRLTGVIRDA